MSIPARYTSSSQKSVVSFHDVPDSRFSALSPFACPSNGLTAFSFEFVAKPDQAASAPSLLPSAIQSGLEDIPGFAGSLVMVSDQEARLITVIIFWNAGDARRSCERSVRRVRALLAPYMDRCLRVQTLFAHLPKHQELRSEPGSIDNCFIGEESVAQEANVCAA